MKALRLIAVLFASLHLAAQQDVPREAPEAPTLTVITRVVAVDALVREPDGAANMSLPQSAFTLKVDGHVTPIRYFNRDNDLPLSVALLIDGSGSQRVYFADEALAAEGFFSHTLTQTGDQAMVAVFDARVAVLQPMTSQQAALRNALRRLDYRDSSLQGQTMLFDAVAELSHAFPASQEGRHALILLTDGDDNGSRLSEQQAIREAQAAGVAVYSVLFTDEMIGNLRYPAVAGTRPSGISVMTDISRATGGRAFIAAKGTTVAEIFAEIEQDLRSQYRFGFTPPPSKPGQRHAIDLRTADKHERVQARDAYIAP